MPSEKVEVGSAAQIVAVLNRVNCNGSEEDFVTEQKQGDDYCLLLIPDV